MTPAERQVLVTVKKLLQEALTAYRTVDSASAIEQAEELLSDLLAQHKKETK